MPIKLNKKLISLIISIAIIISAYFIDGNQDPEYTVVSESASSSSNNTAQIAGEKITPLDATETESQDELKIIDQSNDFFEITRVIDGDTFEIMLNNQAEKVRLIGINTPETVDPRRSVECFGKEASNFAKELLLDQKVKLASDTSQDNRDKYGRLLVYAWLQDGTFFNQIMIERGYAYEYTYKIPYLYQNDFKLAEAIAKSKQLGLWSPDSCAGKK